MVEFHVQEYANREKIIVGLVNSGYKVKLVERPDPKRYLSKLYYIQVEADQVDAPMNVVNIRVDEPSTILTEEIAVAVKQYGSGVAKQ